MLVDTHCHLGDSRFDADRDLVLERARAAGVGHVVVIADSAPATEQAIELATRYGISATAGVHPHEASSWCDDIAARTRAALEHPTVVAVGETGLDYHYDHSPRDAQRHAFEAQLAIAAERRLPVIVHARDADDDVAAMVLEWGGEVPALVLHSFSSGTAVFEAGMAVRAYFGFSGMVTFRNWRGAGYVAACPSDRLLIETDAPYLSPVPHRGKRNEPAFVQHVAERVAELRGEPLELVQSETTANAGTCFGARVAHPDDTEK
ncbi:MAG: TatD family hydrolase [Gemmatimonadota bacterium]|nr:MAG: TatD family hydrolase [Gemmatimonadota bacterium]